MPRTDVIRSDPIQAVHGPPAILGSDAGFEHHASVISFLRASGVGSDVQTVLAEIDGSFTGGILDVAHGGTGADLSSTAGTPRLVRQASSGSVFSIGAAVTDDLTDHAVNLPKLLEIDHHPASLAFPMFIGRVSLGLGEAQVVRMSFSSGVSAAIDDTIPGSETMDVTVPAGSITMSKLANLAGLSVIGRSASGAAGVPAAITGTADQVLRVNTAGTTLGFGTIAYAGIQNVSATDRLLGRQSALAGPIEEITCTAAGRAILDDADAAAQRTTLGLGTLAVLSAPLNVTSGGTGADLHLTGGSNQFVKQASVGAAFTVGTISAAELPSHVHSAADITSGILGVARGGTGADLSSTAGTPRLVRQATSGSVFSIGAAVTGDLTDNCVDLTKLLNFTVNPVVLVPKFLGRITLGTGDPQLVECSFSGGLAVAFDSSIPGSETMSVTVAPAGITMSMLANLAGLSVIGRSANTSGVPAAITAGTDNQVLRRSGTTLGYGFIVTANITDANVTLPKIANAGANSILLGRGDIGTGPYQEITLGTNLSMSGTTLNAAGGGSASNSFATIDCPAGTDPVADSSTDTLQLLAGSTKITITGDATADSITFDVVLAAADLPSHVLADTTGLGAQHTTSGLTAGQVLRATGATTAAFQALVSGDLPSHTHSAATDITGVLGVSHGGTGADLSSTAGTPRLVRQATSGSVFSIGAAVTGDITDGAVTFAKMQTIAINKLLGNDDVGTAVQEITCTPEARSFLSLAGGSDHNVLRWLSGLPEWHAIEIDDIPDAALGSGTPDADSFLRGDRTWAAPPGGNSFGIIVCPSGLGNPTATSPSDTLEFIDTAYIYIEGEPSGAGTKTIRVSADIGAFDARYYIAGSTITFTDIAQGIIFTDTGTGKTLTISAPSSIATTNKTQTLRDATGTFSYRNVDETSANSNPVTGARDFLGACTFGTGSNPSFSVTTTINATLSMNGNISFTAGKNITTAGAGTKFGAGLGNLISMYSQTPIGRQTLGSSPSLGTGLKLFGIFSSAADAAFDLDLQGGNLRGIAEINTRGLALDDATTFVDGSTFLFKIANGLEATLAANALTFEAGATDVGLGWGTSGQLDFAVGAANEMRLTADNLTFEAGATDVSLNWTTSGQLDFQVGGASEMSLTANRLTFDNGTNDTALDWTNDGVLGIYASGVECIEILANTLALISGGIAHTFISTTTSVTFSINTVNQLTWTNGTLTINPGTYNIVLPTTTGLKIGTATTQKLGFFNKTPVIQPAAYTPTNVTTDRSYNANATTTDELADVLGTLIADLQSLGLIG